MIDSLYIGATGMQAQQTNVNVIANNLANVNTTGFKKNRVDFEDLMYRNVANANGLVGSPDNTHRLGVGSTVAASGKVFSDGDLKKTDNAFDFAIRGTGFFEVQLPDGQLGYVRSGIFEINSERFLTTTDGFPLSAGIQIPSDATSILIDAKGKVLATVPNESKPLEIGQLELVSFPNPAGLDPQGNNVYVPTQKSGTAIRNNPGENGAGTIAQGFLESSNVQLVEEMINLILAQRAYEVNAKVVQASDQMLSISNDLYR